MVILPFFKVASPQLQADRRRNAREISSANAHRPFDGTGPVAPIQRQYSDRGCDRPRNMARTTRPFVIIRRA